MNVQFLPLFTLRVAHGFYTGACRDFAVAVPADTAAALRSGRLLAREVEGVLHVLFEADGDGNPRVPIPGATLRFGLQLLNPYFANFTVVPPGFPALRLRYTNGADPEVLDREDDVRFVAETFSHALGEEDRPATVTLRDAAGTTVREDEVTAEDGRTAVSYDLRGRPAGALEVEEAYPGPGTATTALYLDPELRQRDAAVIVEITVDEGFYAAAPAFQVDFDARADVLTYYVVVDGYTPDELDSIAVSDQGAALDERDPVTFDRIETLAEDDLPASLLASANEQIVLFRSAAGLPRRERGRRRIQLAKNGDVLMANLPQPGVERAQADLIIHLSKP